jgi:hypothetical protein
MFELESLIKAKLIDLIVLSQKNRQPDDNPGAKLSLEITLGNDSLAYFDGQLKSFLFTKHGAADKPAQAALDGVQPVSDTPNLTGIGSKIGVMHWEQEMTGYALIIDLGLGGKRSNLEIADCTLSNWRLSFKEGGSFIAKFDAESPDVSESAFGKLAKLKSREIQILLTPPEVQDDAQQTIDDKKPPTAKAAAKPPKGKSATDEFIDRNTAAAH